MPVTSLLYVSRSLLRLPQEGGEVDRIVSVARRENKKLAVTGALIFTEAHFAQVLEGSAEAVEELMGRIRRDSRHTDIKVVANGEQPERSFADWSMAYSGPSLYVDRQIKPLLVQALNASDTGRLTDRLLRLMQEFTVSSSIAAQ